MDTNLKHFGARDFIEWFLCIWKILLCEKFPNPNFTDLYTNYSVAPLCKPAEKHSSISALLHIQHRIKTTVNTQPLWLGTVTSVPAVPEVLC